MAVDPNALAADIVDMIEADTGNDQVDAARIVWLAMAKATAPYFTTGGSGVAQVTAGSSKVSVAPTTGNVVVDVVPANFTGIPQAAVTGLVSDLSAFAASLAGKSNVGHTHPQSDIVDLTTDLAAKAPTWRSIATTSPLTGGGDLSADRTIGLALQTDGVTIQGAGTVASPLKVIGAGASGEVGGGVWAPPAVPHPYDDEFNVGTILGAPWTISNGSVGGTAPDPYASFNVGDSRISHNVQRKHWLMVQPVANNTELAITRTIPGMPTDFAVLMRGCFWHRTTAAINNDFSFALMLSTAPYDASNRVIFNINDADAGIIQAEYGRSVGGVFTSVNTTANIAANDHTAIDVVLIQKIGTTFHGWCWTNNGGGIYLGSQTFAGTIGTAGFWATNNSVAPPGNMYAGVDFIRFYNGIYTP